LRKPPRLATSFLLQFGRPSDPGVGDGLEQFQAGKSRVWYWRQVVGLIVHAAVDDLRQAPALVVGMMICGLLLTMIAPQVITVIIRIISFDRWLFVRGFGWFYRNGYRLPRSVATHPWWIATASYAFFGWCAGHSSQRKHGAVVLMFGSSIVVSNLAHLSYHLATHPVDFDTAYNLIQMIVFAVVILPLATVIGGFSGEPSASNQSGITR
jgi:hypothetical protein